MAWFYSTLIRTMSLCAYPSCRQIAQRKCGGCRMVSYCDTNCQREDWSSHKRRCALHSKGARRLFEQIAERLNRSADTYPFEDFQAYVEERPIGDTASLQEYMEDWLEGPFTDITARKKLLRRLFAEKGLSWSQEVFPMYVEWAENQTGNRFQKMLSFIHEHRMLF